MRIALFCHSLLSDWNHGNAHFLRGVVTELVVRGHEVRVFEPRDAWSVRNLVADHGEEALEGARRAYPAMSPSRYDADALDLEAALDGCQLAIVHEWTDPRIVRRIGELRKRGGRCRVLFHDTHHRAVTRPEEMTALDLSGFDGVLAFGESLRRVYVDRGWARRVWTWHEAADVRKFAPPDCAESVEQRRDVAWIGNWGDDERTRELAEFFLEPVKSLGLRATVHGVRYPEEALSALAEAGVDYKGFLPNYLVPQVFARHLFTVHVPRAAYARTLPGIPTIRPFEAMACGIPLASAPWSDDEGLFRAGEHYLVARDGKEMRRIMRELVNDPGLRRELAARAREAILARHTCSHRVDELLAIAASAGVSAS
jgi:spore maturation protein CgeB